VTSSAAAFEVTMWAKSMYSVAPKKVSHYQMVKISY